MKRGQEFEQRLAKLAGLRDKGVEAYPNDFKPGSTCKECMESCGSMDKEALAGLNKTVVLAGRVMALRDFGKASFARIQDRTGRLQVYFKKEILGEKGFDTFKGIDMGDIVGVEGVLFKTKTWIPAQKLVPAILSGEPRG